MELLKINITGKSASFNKNSISHLSLEELKIGSSGDNNNNKSAV